MRYFICALDRISLGIPAERTERIIPVTRIQTVILETENQNQMAFISLPVLFRQNDPGNGAVTSGLKSNSLRSQPEGMHGVVLKTNCGIETFKTVLLTPRIDVDLEIPEENIHCLPEALTGLFKCFKGAYFTGESVILILNTEKLMENVQ